jgi:DNA-binding response OmpR family regulator
VTTLLVVESDVDGALALRILLSRAGYHVEHTHDGRAAVRAARAVQPDLLVFDMDLSALDSQQVLAAIRELRDVPVLLLAPPDQNDEAARDLRKEAGDYLVKPFDNADLVARVEALLRRADAIAPVEVMYDDGYLRLDANARIAWVDGREVRLTPIEFRLLEVLIRHRDAVLSPHQLLARAWDDPSGVGPDRVKFAVLRLRRKLGARDPEKSPVESVRGFGYRYCQPR